MFSILWTFYTYWLYIFVIYTHISLYKYNLTINLKIFLKLRFSCSRIFINIQAYSQIKKIWFPKLFLKSIQIWKFDDRSALLIQYKSKIKQHKERHRNSLSLLKTFISFWKLFEKINFASSSKFQILDRVKNPIIDTKPVTDN